VFGTRQITSPRSCKRPLNFNRLTHLGDFFERLRKLTHDSQRVGARITELLA
jgi:hypothetical protein